MDQKQQLQDNNNSQQEQHHHEQYNEMAHQRTDRQDAHSNQDQVSYYQQDVRMKRHPELQPYVPSDRYTTLTTGQPPLSSNNKINQHSGGGGISGAGRFYNNNRLVPKQTTSSVTSSSTGDNASGLPKKYCSMTRLNQLAQPKKRSTTAQNSAAPAPTALSSNSSSRSINSINRTLEKQRELKVKAKQQQQPERRAEKQTNTAKQQQSSKKLAEPQWEKANTKPQEQQRQQQQHQQQKRLSDRPQPLTPITSTKTTTMITPLSPASVMPTQTPQSSTPVVRTAKTPRDNLSTPAVQLPTPASSLEEELESATKTNKNDITRDIVVEPSIVEQVSEMSVNDPFYQSAASELVPDSENSTNGINYDRNAESLCREFEQDLIAKGIVKEAADDVEDEFRSPMSNGREDSLRRISAATIVTSENLAQSGESPQGYDEDDRRLKIEKELQEKAKKEDDARKEREQLVTSILSRFSHGSVS